MRISTPLGEYPFEYQRLERREDGVAVVGRVAGFESSVVLGWRDLGRVGVALAAPAAVAALLALRSRRR